MAYSTPIRAILTNSIFLRVKLEDSCCVSVIGYRDHITVEYRDYYYYYYYYCEVIYEMFHILNCGFEIKVSYDHRSYEHNLSNCFCLNES